MSGKYLIFGATGSIGSNLSKMMAENNEDVQLIGRDEENLKNISSETGCKYTVVDVLDSAKIESLKNEFAVNSEKIKRRISPSNNKNSLKKIVIVFIVFAAVVAEKMFL